MCTFGSRLRDRNPPERYLSRLAYLNYLAQHPNDDARFFSPIAEGDWQDQEYCELVSQDARSIQLREQVLPLPSPNEFADYDIELSEGPRVHTFELCRLLAAKHRDLVLATPAERRVSVPEELKEILVLNEWRHPDLVIGELPSATATFVQVADVLASGEVAKYIEPATNSTAPNKASTKAAQASFAWLWAA